MAATGQKEKVIDIINAKKAGKGGPFFSFEYFPPKTDKTKEELWTTLKEMGSWGPQWMDVTWAAGGVTSEQTPQICGFIQNEVKVPAVMHLTCTNMPKEKIDIALKKAKELGIKNIVALRGDPPKGDSEWKPIDTGFACALDLIKHIKAQYGDYFGIVIAGYPEGHPNVRKVFKGDKSKYWAPQQLENGDWEGVSASDWKAELEYLKKKVDAGGEVIITQLFYDAQVFIKFVKEARKIGITVPILPGIMPIRAYGLFKRMCGFCKTIIPEKLSKIMEKVKDNPKLVRIKGMKWVHSMCKTIMEDKSINCPGIHIYTMNTTHTPAMILKDLELGPASKIAQVVAECDKKEAAELKAKEEAEAKKKERGDDDSEEKDDNFVGFIARPRVISQFSYGKHNESQLIELEGAEYCTGSVFLEGVSGVGVTATVVSAYLIKTLDLPLVAVFKSPCLPAMTSIHGYRATPPFRIYGNSKVCVATGDIPVSAAEKSDLLWQIVSAFTDFARRHRCKHIITVEGFPIKDPFQKELKSIEKMLPKKPGVIELGRQESLESVDGNKDPFSQARFLTCDEKIGKKMLELGHIPTKTGQIVGITGAMLSWSFTASPEDPPVTGILAPDPVQLPDQRGALLAVRLMKEVFEITDIDTSELETEAKRLGDKINKTIQDIKTQITDQLSQIAPGPPPSTMYM